MYFADFGEWLCDREEIYTFLLVEVVYVFQGLHSIAGFKIVLYLCHK